MNFPQDSSRVDQNENDSANEDEESEESKKLGVGDLKIFKSYNGGDILDFYQELRNHYAEEGDPWEDTDFPDNPELVFAKGENNEKFQEIYTIEFERMPTDDENLKFFSCEKYFCFHQM